MTGLFPRYEPAGLLSYFWATWERNLWGSGLVPSIYSEPSIADLMALDVGSPVWRPLSDSAFLAVVEELARQVGYDLLTDALTRMRLIALELMFAPPKSVSVAALAGPKVMVDLVAAHASAVDQAIAWARQFLVTRKKNSTDFLMRAMRFPHPFSAAKDPLLHDHVSLIWLLAGREKQGALHGYPLFFHLRAIQSYYHFVLASELTAAGFGIVWRVDAPGLWELQGVDTYAIKVFSKQSADILTWSDQWSDFESRGAARRFAALGSRRILAPTPEISLTDARKQWALEVPQLSCMALRANRNSPGQLAIGGWERYFLPSAVTTRAMLIGRILGDCVGQNVSIAEARRHVEEAMEAAISSGVLAAHEPSAICHLELFQVEQRILEAVRAGLGEGSPCKLTLPKNRPEGSKVPRRVASAGKRPDRIRIISANGEVLPGDTAVEYSDTSQVAEAPWLICLAQWNPAEVLSYLNEDERETGGTRNILVVVEAPDHAGDFLRLVSGVASVPSGDSLGKSKQLRVGKKPIELIAGELPVKPGQRFPLLEGRPPDQIWLAVAGRDYPENVRCAWNYHAGREWVLHQPNDLKGPMLELDIPVPWPKLGEPFDWKGKGLFAFKQGAIHHGHRWTILDAFGDPCRLMLKGVGKSKEVYAAEVINWQNSVALVNPMEFRYVPGLQMEVLLRFEKSRLVLKKGELVLFREVLSDCVILEDGRVVPNEFRAFAPALIMADLKPSRTRPADLLCLTDPFVGDIWKRLRQFRGARRLVVMTNELAKAKALLAHSLSETMSINRKRKIHRIFSEEKGAGGVVLPPRGVWVTAANDAVTKKKEGRLFDEGPEVLPESGMVLEADEVAETPPRTPGSLDTVSVSPIQDEQMFPSAVTKKIKKAEEEEPKEKPSLPVDPQLVPVRVDSKSTKGGKKPGTGKKKDFPPSEIS